MNRFLLRIGAVAVALWSVTARALPPTPAAPQQRPTALIGATAHLGTGAVIEDAVISFAGGRITGVGPRAAAGALDGHERIDVAGSHVYPGLVLPGSNLGLREIGSLPETLDLQETGELNPSARAIIAYNTDSELIPVTRFNGVLIAQVAPTGGLVSGTSSIVELDGWNWQDAALVVDDGIHVSWPAATMLTFDPPTFVPRQVLNEAYPDQLQSLKKLFRDARAYAADPEVKRTNLKLAALAGAFDGSRSVYLYTDEPADVVLGVNFLRELGIPRIVLMATGAALETAAFLTEHKVPVIVQGVHRTPVRDYSDVDRPYRLPALLIEAGLTVGLTYPSVMNARNLPFIAGTAAAYGLDREQALRLITLSNAEILGIAERVGSLEVGKDATLFVSSGDALDMRGNAVTIAFIRGKRLNLDGMQQELYRRYREKYASPE